MEELEIKKVCHCWPRNHSWIERLFNRCFVCFKKLKVESHGGELVF